jgi:transposase-like protein
VKLTLKSLRERVQDETDAYLLLEELRWHGEPVCPHCGNKKAYFLNPQGGARGTGPKRHDGQRTKSVRRVWKCAACRKQFSVLTGTIFHGTKVSLADWLTVMVLMSSAKNGISAREVERLIGVTPETAWFMLHRLRESMKREPLVGMLRGVVVADESYIGGKFANRHKNDKRARPERVKPGGRRGGGPAADKTIVLSLVSQETGEVRSRVIPDVTGASLRKAIAEEVDMASTVLFTDEHAPYRQLRPELLDHATVNHKADEYVRYEGDRVVTSNAVEGYFSQLKRSLDGTHHHVSSEHLHRYLNEFDFKYTTRKLSDPARLQQMVDGAAGRRLSYKPLTERS